MSLVRTSLISRKKGNQSYPICVPFRCDGQVSKCTVFADDYSGAKFNAQETADGKAVTGSYQVALPDGRIQTVTYTADHYNGYVADVKYEGTPVYPEAKPYHPAPKPGYHA